MKSFVAFSLLALITFSIACVQKKIESPKPESTVFWTRQDERQQVYSELIKKTWIQNNFDVTEDIKTLLKYPGKNSTPKYHLNLQVIVLQNSGWTDVILNDRYTSLKAIFTQCGLDVSVYILRINALTNLDQVDPGDDNRNSSELFAEKFPKFKNTVFMIHVKSLIENIAGTSAPLMKYKAEHPLIHKNWISILGLQGSMSDALYVTEAHELGHDLFNMNHTDYKNLMGGVPWYFASTITEEQCESLKTHSEIEVL